MSQYSTPSTSTTSSTLAVAASDAAAFDPSRLEAVLGTAPRRGPAPWWRRRSTVLPAAALSAVALIGGGVVVVRDAGATSAGNYRTAQATRRNVSTTLNTVATIEPVDMAAVGFVTAGTVESVTVGVGDTVEAGAILASVSTDALSETVTNRQLELAQAELALERLLDTNSTATGSTTASSSGRSSTGTSSSAAASNSASNSAASSATTSTAGGVDLSVERSAVAEAQAAVTTAQQHAQAALVTSESVCASATQQTATQPTSTQLATSVEETTTTTAAGSTTTAPTPAEDVSGDAADNSCATAIAAVSRAQQSYAQALTSLANAVEAMSSAVEASATTSTQRLSQGTAQSATAQSATAPAASATTPAASGAASSSATAEDLIAAQKSIDAAFANLVAAITAFSQATIVSPIAGTVVSVGIAVGDEVSAGSSTQTIVIATDEGYEVSTTVSVAQVADLEIGQAATVRPDGSDAELTGSVVFISPAPSSSDTYSVVIGLDDASVDLHNGSIGSVEIVTSATTEALAVPSSAITMANGSATISVLSDGVAEQRTVTLGVRSATWTEVRSNIEEGDVVVVSNLDDPLPTSATDTESSNTNSPFGDGAPSFGPGGGFGGRSGGAAPSFGAPPR